MKRQYLVSLLAYLILALATPYANGAAVSLFDYAFNIDGVLTANPGVPGGVNDAAFNYSTGLGSLSISVAGQGNHFIGLFVDHDIDASLNTFFNETGQSVGVKPAGVSWQLDEPGFVSGNIYTHFANSTAAASALDNSNKVAPGMPNDVSMGLGHSFTLLVGQSATVVFDLTTAAPPSGFYLAQTDPDSNASIFFSSRGVSIFGQATAVPEPGSALVGLFCFGIVTSTLLRRSQLRAPGRCGS